MKRSNWSIGLFLTLVSFAIVSGLSGSSENPWGWIAAAGFGVAALCFLLIMVLHNPSRQPPEENDSDGLYRALYREQQQQDIESTSTNPETGLPRGEKMFDGDWNDRR